MSDRWRGSADLEEADIRLLERLGAIAEIVDPVPDHVREMSRALFAFRDPDVELMQVVELEGGQLEAVRGSTTVTDVRESPRWFTWPSAGSDEPGETGVLVDVHIPAASVEARRPPS